MMHRIHNDSRMIGGSSSSPIARFEATHHEDRLPKCGFLFPIASVVIGPP